MSDFGKNLNKLWRTGTWPGEFGESASLFDAWIKFHKAIATAITLFEMPRLIEPNSFHPTWAWVASLSIPRNLLSRLGNRTALQKPTLRTNRRFKALKELMGQAPITCEEGCAKMLAVLLTQTPWIIFGFRFLSPEKEQKFREEIWDPLDLAFPSVASTNFVYQLLKRPFPHHFPHEVRIRLVRFVQANNDWRRILIAIARYQYLFALEKGGFQPVLNTFCGFGELAYFVYWLIGDGILDKEFTRWLLKEEFNNQLVQPQIQ